MPRSHLAYEVADISALARSLRDGLGKLEGPPGHVQLLNLLARAAGFRNFQHFRADHAARQPPEAPAPAPAPDHARAAKAARLFDAGGGLTRWPKKRNQQLLCLWVLWSRIPAGEVFAERQVNELLNGWHHFGDYALLRREMVDLGLLRRTPDGREYSRVEQPPPAELGAMLALTRAAA
ncbi:DUF2087 domain-containing protein [Bosea sp. 117]|uniref:DUF2087 domain-containing protein n=1 Tax=Bosea sp. 117 TaxID=1125973 RepID=UPI00049422AD|nr:DUF2087 domain-containing protein [Bosea sp. 117]